MALQKDYTIPNTTYTVSGAYHIITEIEVKKRNEDDPGPVHTSQEDNIIAKETSDALYWKKGYTSKLKIDVYVNKEARLSGKSPIGTLGIQSSELDSQLATAGMDHKIVFYLDADGESNIFEQAYSYLKSTQYYSDATDV
jgi:hypothetical protein